MRAFFRCGRAAFSAGPIRTRPVRNPAAR